MTPARILYENCPLCHGTDWLTERIADCMGHVLWHYDLPPEIRWVRCFSCEHVFTEGYFTDEVLKTIFSRVQEGQTPGPATEAGRLIASRIIGEVAKRETPCSGLSQWLDVGFGNGSLLTTAAEFGYEVIGVDARQCNVGAMKALGITAFTDMTGLHDMPPCDVISMADVLEHMPFPVEALWQVYGLLRPQGLLFLSMPNSDCAVWRMLDQRGENPYWQEIEHYHNFGRRRLERLLRTCGFEPISYGVSERYRVGMEIIARKVY